ncbi:MAG: cupin domain-containing protein [Alphaproteobacteria bacterium]|nr:cupin domain-containing protein [Alphaproteobacteria bacterium]
MPAFPISVRVTNLPEQVGTDYPSPYNQPCLERRRRALGDVFGLSQFGVNLLELSPGTWSAQRHWHEREDEFVYVLEGEVDLVTDAGSTTLSAGMIAGFRAGEPNGHHLVNRSGHVARVLEVGTRSNAETAHYADIDMLYREVGVPEGYYRRDGSPYR